MGCFTAILLPMLFTINAVLIHEGCCQSLAGTVLNSSEEIKNVTKNYFTALEVQFGKQWLFPSIRFITNGTIIGWRFASVNNAGRGIPRLNVWTPDSPESSDDYTLSESVSMQQCIVSEARQDDGTTVRFHTGGPTQTSEGLMFREGDILGILFRSANAASFAPYLYNTSVVNLFQNQLDHQQPPIGYFLSTRAERTQLSLQNLQADTLLPLLSLDICIESSGGDEEVRVCMANYTVNWQEECEEEQPISTLTTDSVTTFNSEITENVTAATWPFTTGAASPETDSLQSMIIVIASAAGGGAAVLLVGCLLVVVVVSCCVCRKKRKRRKCATTNDIVLDSATHNGDVHMTTIDGQFHTYASLDQGERTSTFIVSITDELRNGTNSGPVENGNGSPGNQSSVATYEQPIFSQSQYESPPGEEHAYDQIRPTNKHLKVGTRVITPLPELPHPYSTHQLPPITPAHPYGSHHDQQSPLMPRTPLPPASSTPTTVTTFYHSLENGSSAPPLISPLLLSSTVTHTTQLSPEFRRSGRSPTTKESPEPRYRLRSHSQGMKRPKKANERSTTPTSFFSLETGVYVPTQDQREQFGHFSTDSEPIFDDKVYACLSQAADNPFVNNWSFFEESECYWKPASNSTALYEQLSHKKYREILRKQIEITGHLGSGQFGKVAKGVWHTDQGDLDVAVKMLNKKATERDAVRFLQEAAIMGQFKHPNIVRLHGVVTVGHPVMMVLELMLNGDLRNYLKSLRPVPGEMVPANLPRRLLDFCSQIALGMEYLSRKDFVHRDLATRNILLTDDYICKIADFGMSRDLDDEDYYMSQGGIIPIKWTAPEALNYRKYSPASDVWSFGVLLYEVWSLGHTPFKNKTPEETISLVEEGHRLSPPPGCPKAVYQLMIDCWHPEHSSRPTFTKLVQALSQPEEDLLKWSVEDSNIHTQVTSLGAPLKIGERLYPELSKMYTSTTD